MTGVSTRSSTRASRYDDPRVDLSEALSVADPDAQDGTKDGLCTQVFTKVCGVCVRRLILPSDTRQQKEFKTMMCIVWAGSLAITLSSGTQLTQYSRGLIYPVGLFATFLVVIVPLVYSFVTRRIPVWTVEMIVIVWAAVILLADWRALAQVEDRSWPFIVIFLDVALLLDLPMRTSYCAIGMSISWMAFVAMNTLVDFGLLSEPMTDYRVPEICDCTRPPCATNKLDGTSARVFGGALPLILDFYLTRRFAFSAKAEKAAMQSSIDTAQRLATMLSLFDLDTAEKILNERRGATTMPPELCRAFGSILQNLRTYKPYLPHSCLPEELQRGAQKNEDSAGSDLFTNTTTASTDDTATGSESDESLAPSGLCRKALTLRQALAEQQKPQWKRVTLVHSNLHNTLLKREGNDDCVADGFAQYFSGLLTYAINVCQTQGGGVDLFVGDRIFVSFNTFRHTGRHAHRAASVCKELYEFGSEFAQLNIGVVSGRALCGDGGCEAMRRYSVLGHVSVLAHAYERVGRTLGVAMLCNEQFSGDVRNDHQVRIVPRPVRFARRGHTDEGSAQPPCRVHELVPQKSEEASERGGGPQEWMYEIADNCASRVWESYDECVRKYLGGASADAVVEELRSCEGVDSDTVAALEAQLAKPAASSVPYEYES